MIGSHTSNYNHGPFKKSSVVSFLQETEEKESSGYVSSDFLNLHHQECIPEDIIQRNLDDIVIPSRSWPSSRRNSPDIHDLWNSLGDLTMEESHLVNESFRFVGDSCNDNLRIKRAATWTFDQPKNGFCVKKMSSTDALDLASLPQISPRYRESHHWNTEIQNMKSSSVHASIDQDNHHQDSLLTMSKDVSLDRILNQPSYHQEGTGDDDLCFYFIQGYCARGNQCLYSHNAPNDPYFHTQNHLQRGLTHPIPKTYLVYQDELYPLNNATRSNSIHSSHPMTSNNSNANPRKQLTRKASFIQDKFTNAVIQDFKGQILFLSKDQQGCRFLQKKLDEGDSVKTATLIFEEIKDSWADLMMDPFGNYLFQKLLDHLDESQKALIVHYVSDQIVSTSFSMHGTRAVQKLCESIKDHPVLVGQIVESLRDYVILLIKDLNGNHVIQKCLIIYKEKNNQFIYDSISSQCMIVATHRHGCCVIQRCIDHATPSQRDQLVSRVTYYALPLVQNSFGNYVVQYILDLNNEAFTQSIIQSFYGDVVLLSTQKFSSNVMEKCIRVANEATKERLISELLSCNCMDRLLGDSFANYVLQTCLDFANATQKQELIELILPILPSIRHTPHGKRIYSKMCSLEGSLLSL